jgi:hypothetical protein
LSPGERASTRELGDQLAMGKKRGQTLLGRHASDVLAEAIAGSVGQWRSHAAM